MIDTTWRNRDNYVARGDYGIRVARPGYDAMNCSDNQLLFNSGWPILQIIGVIDFGKINNTLEIISLNDEECLEEIPSWASYNSTYSIQKYCAVNDRYAIWYYESDTYTDTQGLRRNLRVDRFKIANNDMGIVPMFIPARTLYTGGSPQERVPLETDSEAVLFFNVDLTKDVDYPYEESPAPILGVSHDYGIKSQSIFGENVPGLNTNQFSMLVQAVKTQETIQTSGTPVIWSKVQNRNEELEGFNLNEYDGYAFNSLYSFDTPKKLGSQFYTGEPCARLYSPALALMAGNTRLIEVPKLSTLVVLRSPMVSPEIVEVKYE